MSLATKSISVASSYYSIKGVLNRQGGFLDSQARRAGCLGQPFESVHVGVAGK